MFGWVWCCRNACVEVTGWGFDDGEGGGWGGYIGDGGLAIYRGNAWHSCAGESFGER